MRTKLVGRVVLVVVMSTMVLAGPAAGSTPCDQDASRIDYVFSDAPPTYGKAEVHWGADDAQVCLFVSNAGTPIVDQAIVLPIPSSVSGGPVQVDTAAPPLAQPDSTCSFPISESRTHTTNLRGYVYTSPPGSSPLVVCIGGRYMTGWERHVRITIS